MSSYFHSDPWYTSSKATLRPLTYYSEEGFEVENNHLCGRVNQLATDCISEAKDKGMVFSIRIIILHISSLRPFKCKVKFLTFEQVFLPIKSLEAVKDASPPLSSAKQESFAL